MFWMFGLIIASWLVWTYFSLEVSSWIYGSSYLVNVIPFKYAILFVMVLLAYPLSKKLGKPFWKFSAVFTVVSASTLFWPGPSYPFESSIGFTFYNMLYAMGSALALLLLTLHCKQASIQGSKK